MYMIMCIETVQNTEKWLQMDRQLLAMTDNVDYDVEGIVSISSLMHGKHWT